MNASGLASDVGMLRDEVLAAVFRPSVAGRSLRALMEFAENAPHLFDALEALQSIQVYVLAVRPVLPSHLHRPCATFRLSHPL
jgi:hypothetical protein